MLKNARRIVTGLNTAGKSIVTYDGPPASVVGVENAGIAKYWSTAGGPMDRHAQVGEPEGPLRLVPLEGGSNFFLFGLEPGDPDLPMEELEAQARAGFAAVDASDCQTDTSRHPAMHQTGTIDYIILLKGEVTLLLEEDERALRPFDVVVQRGTNHAWINTGDEPALLACILIDTEIDTKAPVKTAPDDAASLSGMKIR